MNLVAGNFGECGSVNAFYVGKISYDDSDIDTGEVVYEAPAPMVISQVAVEVKTAFNAGTTNVLTFGSNAGVDNLCGSSDITEGSTGMNVKSTFLKLAKGDKVKAKYAQTGTAATAGAAEIYFIGTRLPE